MNSTTITRRLASSSTIAITTAIAIALSGAAASETHASLVPNGTLHVVTSCADDGPGTLRAAVASAQSGDRFALNQLPSSDKTITLTSGAIPISVAPLMITAGGITSRRADTCAAQSRQ